MKYFIALFFLLNYCFLLAQEISLKDFEVAAIPFSYQNAPVDILLYHPEEVKERTKKPLLLFVQGSLPIPLCKYDTLGNKYPVFPFDPKPYIADYHIAIIGKPSIPIISKVNELASNFTYREKETKTFPKGYCERNHLDYYANRNNAVLDFFSKKEWVDSSKIVVIGHSEGYMVAFKMALNATAMTHIALLNGNLFGRMMSILIHERARSIRTNDSLKTESLFPYWQELNEQELHSDDCARGDSDKATFSFSYPLIEHIEAVNIPVFVGYGTRDGAVLLNDYLRLQTIRYGKTNYYYKAYFGLEHNFFGFNKEGTINYDDYNFDRVVEDIMKWVE